MALAEQGRFADAATHERRAIDLARAAGQPTAGLDGRVGLYAAGKPLREPWKQGTDVH
jgi:hypothetical protein